MWPLPSGCAGNWHEDRCRYNFQLLVTFTAGCVVKKAHQDWATAVDGKAVPNTMPGKVTPTPSLFEIVAFRSL